MKKFLALLLALMCLSATAMAEVVTGEATIDLGFATLALGPNDVAIAGDKTESGILALIYPDYDEEASFHSSMNIVWTEENIVSDITNNDEAAAFLEAVIAEMTAGLSAEGVTASNPVSLLADVNEETSVVSLFYIMDVDYASLGLDQVITLYTMQIYLPVEGDGLYMITLSSDTPEGIEALRAVMANFQYE